MDVVENLSRWLSRNSASLRGVESVSSQISLGSWIGRREVNQDIIAFGTMGIGRTSTSTRSVLVVCDGIGGMKDGGRAAVIAVASLLKNIHEINNLNPRDILSLAVQGASRSVFEMLAGEGGCTMSAALWCNDDVFTVSVGDSRLFSVDELGIKQISTDDTLAGHVKDIDPQTAELPEYRSLIQFIGMDAALNLDIRPIDASVQQILVASDGVHFLGKDAIHNIFRNAANPKIFVSRTLAIAEWFGGRDNASVAVVPLRLNLPWQNRDWDDSTMHVWDAYGTMTLYCSESVQEKCSDVGVKSANVGAENVVRRKRGPKLKNSAKSDLDTVRETSEDGVGVHETRQPEEVIEIMNVTPQFQLTPPDSRKKSKRKSSP